MVRLISQIAGVVGQFSCPVAWMNGAAALAHCTSRSVHGPAARQELAGQPTHTTHPELLGPGELAPGISARAFAERRAALARLMPRGSIAVVPAAATAFVTGVIPHPYRQDADALYLTGLQQQFVAVIEAGSDDTHAFHLYLPSPDGEKERWDGAWAGAAAARHEFGADEVHSVLELPARVQHMAASASAVLFDFDRHTAYQFPALRSALHDAAAKGRSMPLRPHMHRLRWVKSPAELRLMRASAAISAHAVRRCMALSHAGVHEGALALEFEYAVRRAGAARLAYPTVAGGGPDACTIHYSRNDKAVQGGQLLLMDAGAEFHGYVSDVTRTWPVAGIFSAEQRALYEAVLRVRARCLEQLVPGSTLGKVHALSVRLLSEALVELRLLPGVSAEQLAAGAYRPFYAHSVGHYLGMDVHDTNTVGPHRTLESGVVLALEPALYVPNSPQFGRYAGLGVRLEDDVLVTPSGPEVLSSAAPLQPDDVEAAVCAGPEAADSAAAAAAAAAAAVLATNAGHERWPARVRWGIAGGVVDGEGMLAAHEATA